jgi:hypothetical protein
MFPSFATNYNEIISGIASFSPALKLQIEATKKNNNGVVPSWWGQLYLTNLAGDKTIKSEVVAASAAGSELRTLATRASRIIFVGGWQYSNGLLRTVFRLDSVVTSLNGAFVGSPFFVICDSVDPINNDGTSAFGYFIFLD